jgi:predicted 3-demethylubiquinone-9 3-methyltransferase (glyoxalase superfamily)
MPTAKPFLMFVGNAQAAMDLYVATIPNSHIVRTARYDNTGPAPAGTIKIADFTLCGREFLCSDSPIKHEFSFTPSSSIFVECDSLEMLERIFGPLSHDGKVLMPPGNYGFSKQFCWLTDRFGVSW